MTDTDQFTDQEIIAKTLWGEARNQTHEGRVGVCNVIFNRPKLAHWWGTNPRDVCLHPFQFSSWNNNDPNRPKIMAVTEADPIYAECLSIARDAFADDLPDVTSGADSYCVTGTNAKWAVGLTPVAVIGRHSFYRTI